MRALYKYLKGFKKELILGPAFKLIEAIFELIVPLVMASIIDVGVRNGDRDYVLQMGGVMVLLSAIGLCSTLVCQYFAAKASQGFGTVLRNKLFSHIISGLSHKEIDKIGTPSLITRMTNDINQLQVGMAMLIRLAVRAPFLVIGATVMAVSIDARLAFIFLAAAVGITVVLYFIMKKSGLLYSAVQKLLDRVGLLTRETLAGTRVIRAFSRQSEQKRKFNEANDELKQASVRVGRISALLNPLTYVIVNIAIIAILWFGGTNVNEGLLEQGQVVALVNYMTQIQLALIVVANLVIIFTKAGASGARVAEVLEMKGSVQEGAADFTHSAKEDIAIELKDVFFCYASNEYELEDINLKIKRGQTVGVIGGTGAGKTTLINLIPRFYDATKGTVKVDGKNVRDYTFAELCGKIGMVPQKSSLFAGTIRQNMQWAKPNATDEEIQTALETAQAAEFVKQYKYGLDTNITQGGANLSGGQRQRLAIARALVGSPEILILDDSASALDFATDAALRKALYQMDELTVVMVSQRVGTLKNADSIVVMDDGRILGIGTHEELFETNDVYREICLSQLEVQSA